MKPTAKNLRGNEEEHATHVEYLPLQSCSEYTGSYCVHTANCAHNNMSGIIQFRFIASDSEKSVAQEPEAGGGGAAWI